MELSTLVEMGTNILVSMCAFIFIMLIVATKKGGGNE